MEAEVVVEMVKVGKVVVVEIVKGVVEGVVEVI